MRPLPALFAIVATLAFSLSADAPDEFKGKVVSNQSGDTFQILADSGTEFTVHIHGIDAPEDGQPHYVESKSSLSKLIVGKKVTCKVEGRVKADEVRARVHLAAKDIGQAMVHDGLAWHDINGAPKDTKLADTEKDAQRRSVGIWKDPNPVPPWTYRLTSSQPASVSGSQSRPSAAGSGSQTSKPAPSEDTTVYVTKTGSKYHTAGCSHLRKSAIATSLSKAKKSFEPCEHCHPPH